MPSQEVKDVTVWFPGQEREQTLYGLLDRLVSHHRLTALICSQELDLVFRYADQVLCLNRQNGPATALYRHRPRGRR